MVEIEPLGDTSIIVQFGNTLNTNNSNEVQAFCHLLDKDKNKLPGMIEYIPAYTTVTIVYDPVAVYFMHGISPYIAMKRNVGKLLSTLELTGVDTITPTVIFVPVCYGGEFGPDIDTVATTHSLSRNEVIQIHTSEIYNVAMIGFAPGFPYLTGLNQQIATPRLANPRLHVPQGSVGIAGVQTGIYSIDSPGGWNIIGRTPLKLVDFNNEQPSLLTQGDLVKFVAITEQQFLEGRQKYEYNS